MILLLVVQSLLSYSLKYHPAARSILIAKPFHNCVEDFIAILITHWEMRIASYPQIW